jgi:hypothetical protein
VIRLNIITAQADHQQKPIRLLQLQKILGPIQTLCKELESDFLVVDHTDLNSLLSHLYIKAMSAQLDSLYAPYLIWIFQKSCQPLFKFISGCIGNCASDPFNEFFIVDDQYLSHKVPSFIPQTLAVKIYNLRNFDHFPELQINFCPFWIINLQDRKEYLGRFEELVAFQRDLYRDNYLQVQMDHLNDLQLGLDRRLVERTDQERVLSKINSRNELEKEMIENRKKELRRSVEVFLEEQREFKRKQQRLRDFEVERELNANEIKNAERERLIDMERDQIVTRFETALKKLEKREFVLEWRQKRVDLVASREALLSQPWSSTEFVFAESPGPQLLEMQPPASPQIEEQESFYSAEAHSSKGSIYNVDDNSNDTNHVEQVLVSPNNNMQAVGVKNVDTKDTSSQVTIL